MNKLYRKENKEKRDRQWSNFLKKESRTLWATSVKIISKNLTLCTIENLLPSPLRFNIVNKTNMCVCCFRAYLYLLRGRNSFERQTCNLFIWTTKRAWGSLNATVGWRLKKDLLLFGSTYLPTFFPTLSTFGTTVFYDSMCTYIDFYFSLLKGCKCLFTPEVVRFRHA